MRPRSRRTVRLLWEGPTRASSNGKFTSGLVFVDVIFQSSCSSIFDAAFCRRTQIERCPDIVCNKPFWLRRSLVAFHLKRSQEASIAARHEGASYAAATASGVHDLLFEWTVGPTKLSPCSRSSLALGSIFAEGFFEASTPTAASMTRTWRAIMSPTTRGKETGDGR